MAHDQCGVGAGEVILHGRPMLSDDNEIGLGFLGNCQNLGIDAPTMGHENVGLKVGRIGAPDLGVLRWSPCPLVVSLSAQPSRLRGPTV